MIVDFFVAGVQKAGTTALHAMLSRHPDVAMSVPKETHFFDNEAVNWGAPDYAPLHSAFPRHARLHGEATPITLFWPAAMERLSRYNPRAKLIISLRQPALRAHSQWRMERSRGAESRSFAEVIAAGLRSLGDRNATPHRVHSYLARGFYAPQIQRALRLFPRHQLHFLRVDRLWERPSQEMRRITGFLGLTDMPPAERSYIVPLETRALGRLNRSSQAYLTALFSDDIAQTAKLTGLDLSDWLHPGYEEAMQLQDQV